MPFTTCSIPPDPALLRRIVLGQLHRPVAGAIAALAVGGVASAFLAPVPLLQATAAVHRNASAQSLLGGTASTEVYLKLGSSTSGADRRYYPVTAVHLSTAAGHTGLKFSTSSLVLLGQVLQASAGGGKVPAVTLAFRTPRTCRAHCREPPRSSFTRGSARKARPRVLRPVRQERFFTERTRPQRGL